MLCPPIGGDVQNITIDAVLIDTTVPALSGLGTEPALLLASRGDSLDTRVVIRFDSLPETFIPAGDTAKPVTSVDSAYIQLQLDTLSIKGTDPVTIEAYDVDTTANDTSSEAILALFRPDRFISSQTFARADLKDTVKYFIPNAALLGRIQSRAPLRIGLRAVSTGSTQMRFASSESRFGPELLFRATPDTLTKPLIVFPFSKTPVGQGLVATDLADYTVIAKGPPPAPPGVLAIGGLPARRVYVQFNIPSKFIDSATVVRATLLLNQLPLTGLDPTDTVRLQPQVVLAGSAVLDPVKAAQIIGDFNVDTLKVIPGGSGRKNVELARAFALWRTVRPDTLPRAIVLKSVTEGNSPLEIRFSSSEDPNAALRPQLRISFTNKVPLGLP